MTLFLGYQWFLKDSDFVNTRLRFFSASARTKKLKDNKEKGGENEIMDLFLATTGCEAIMSLHHGVSHKPERLDFWKNKTDHKKKY